MRKVKIGVVGCGNISGIYFDNLTKVFANTEVYACADLMEERAKQAAEKYGIPHVMTTDDLLDCKEIEIVLNLTTPQGHFDLCKAALEKGKHVYVEKPLSLMMEQGNELVELAKKKNLMLGCAPDTFMGAGIQTARKLIDDDFIGEPIGGTAFMVCHGHESWHPDPEFYYKKGGGPMFDMGPYYLTALVNLIGPAKTVAGMTSMSFAQRKITSEPKRGTLVDVEVPTHVSGNIQFKNGAVVSVITSFDVWGSRLPCIEIYGTKGSVVVPDPNTFGGEVLYKSSFAKDFTPVAPTHGYCENSRGLGVSDMAECILKGGVNRACGELANHVLEIMHAFHISSDSKAYYEMKTTCEKPKPMSRD